MTFQDWLPALGAQAAMMTPTLLACAVGVVLCVSWKRRIGVGAVYGAAAFSLEIVGALLGLAGQAWMYKMLDSGMPASSAGMINSMVGVVHVLLSLVSTGLLIAAVLAKRPAPPQA
ncbi:hypothetical protein J5226_02615 [Lysobacter sp. K5869]|uniref:hypothetical protein n=1 Tax=Lysobacter sp. K5869 TaxID=2820808 RepID=UPI001C05FB0E|nr:hypothetical protein [Lysobacter sp. K5869]QWP77317.1 hypothetical protein J5226_02615 [Lysobacter sp. K5869]